VGETAELVRVWQDAEPLPRVGWLVELADGLRDPADAAGALPFDTTVVPVEVAITALALAPIVGRRAPATQARLVRTAERILLDCGADGDVERSRQAAAGVTRRGRPPRRTRHGWESLTPTERLVVAHLGEGRSNQEISEELGVGRRTVESHVASVLRKLQLRSRLAVAAAARDAGHAGS
jgi:DNA-binding NarL/FixJ family response regulator